MEDELARLLAIWITGCDDAVEYVECFGVSPDEAWDDMTEWERDDYRLAARKMKEHLRVT